MNALSRSKISGGISSVRYGLNLNEKANKFECKSLAIIRSSEKDIFIA